MTFQYYSERQGQRTPLQEDIGQRFWNGFKEYVANLIEIGFFIERFPVECQDGEGLRDTDLERLARVIYAEIEYPWPIPDGFPPTMRAMDGIEFFGRVVSKPKTGVFHPFWRHTDYSEFDRSEGFDAYRQHINELLRACGHPYELTEDGQIVHIGPQTLANPLKDAEFVTGDPILDSLLVEARSRFFSSDPKVRREALEKLWDAFERLKTVEPGPDKKKSAELLLIKAIPDPTIRAKIELECKELTDIGNNFRIRHHEAGKHEINNDLDVDYLFYRLYGVINRLLTGTNRVRRV
jgi:hypothetical protein